MRLILHMIILPFQAGTEEAVKKWRKMLMLLPCLTMGVLLPIQAQNLPVANVGDVVISGIVEEIELPRVRFTGSTPQISAMPDAAAERLLNRQMREMEQAALARAKAAVLALASDDGSERAVEGVFGYEVKRNGRGLVSILFHDYLYSGGANGRTIMTGLTFSSGDGKVYRLKDLFQNKETFSAVLDEHIRRQLRDRGLEAQLLKTFTGLSGDECFYVSDSDLVIVIQELDWFPHSMGVVEFPIPLAELSMYTQNILK